MKSNLAILFPNETKFPAPPSRQSLNSTRSGISGNYGRTPSESISSMNSSSIQPTTMTRDTLTCFLCKNLFKEPMILSCGHSFCRKCVDRWLRKCTNCPMCRTTTLQPIHNITLGEMLADFEKSERKTLSVFQRSITQPLMRTFRRSRRRGTLDEEAKSFQRETIRASQRRPKEFKFVPKENISSQTTSSNAGKQKKSAFSQKDEEDKENLKSHRKTVKIASRVENVGDGNVIFHNNSDNKRNCTTENENILSRNDNFRQDPISDLNHDGCDMNDNENEILKRDLISANIDTHRNDDSISACSEPQAREENIDEQEDGDTTNESINYLVAENQEFILNNFRRRGTEHTARTTTMDQCRRENVENRQSTVVCEFNKFSKLIEPEEGTASKEKLLKDAETTGFNEDFGLRRSFSRLRQKISYKTNAACHMPTPPPRPPPPSSQYYDNDDNFSPPAERADFASTPVRGAHRQGKESDDEEEIVSAENTPMTRNVQAVRVCNVQCGGMESSARVVEFGRESVSASCIYQQPNCCIAMSDINNAPIRRQDACFNNLSTITNDHSAENDNDNVTDNDNDARALSRHSAESEHSSSGYTSHVTRTPTPFSPPLPIENGRNNGNGKNGNDNNVRVSKHAKELFHSTTAEFAAKTDTSQHIAAFGHKLMDAADTAQADFNDISVFVVSAVHPSHSMYHRISQAFATNFGNIEFADLPPQIPVENQRQRSATVLLFHSMKSADVTVLVYSAQDAESFKSLVHFFTSHEAFAVCSKATIAVVGVNDGSHRVVLEHRTRRFQFLIGAKNFCEFSDLSLSNSIRSLFLNFKWTKPTASFVKADQTTVDGKGTVNANGDAIEIYNPLFNSSNCRRAELDAGIYEVPVTDNNSLPSRKDEKKGKEEKNEKHTVNEKHEKSKNNLKNSNSSNSQCSLM